MDFITKPTQVITVEEEKKKKLTSYDITYMISYWTRWERKVRTQDMSRKSMEKHNAAFLPCHVRHPPFFLFFPTSEMHSCPCRLFFFFPLWPDRGFDCVCRTFFWLVSEEIRNPHLGFPPFLIFPRSPSFFFG